MLEEDHRAKGSLSESGGQVGVLHHLVRSLQRCLKKKKILRFSVVSIHE